MLARHHWAVLKTSGSPKCLCIFPPPVLNVVASLALQTLGGHQGMSSQAPQCAHQHRGSPAGWGGKLIGKENHHPHTNLFVSHSFSGFFFTFSPPQNKLKGKALFARIFSGRVSWRSWAAFAAHRFSDPSKASVQLPRSRCRCVVRSHFLHLLCLATTV